MKCLCFSFLPVHSFATHCDWVIEHKNLTFFHGLSDQKKKVRQKCPSTSHIAHLWVIFTSLHWSTLHFSFCRFCSEHKLQCLSLCLESQIGTRITTHTASIEFSGSAIDKLFAYICMMQGLEQWLIHSKERKRVQRSPMKSWKEKPKQENT